MGPQKIHFMKFIKTSAPYRCSFVRSLLRAGVQPTLKTVCRSNVLAQERGGNWLVCASVCVMCRVKGKGKGFPYSTPSVGPGADPGVQAVSLQVTVSHPPGGRLPLLSTRPAVTSPAAEHHRPLAGTKLYCLVTEAHRGKQLA